MQEWFDTRPCLTGLLLTPTTASTYLQQVSKASTSIGLGDVKWKYKRWRFYRDGWSPFMLANQAQYRFLLKIHCHLLDQHGYTKWSPHGYYQTSGSTRSLGKKPFTAPFVETKTRKPSADTSPPSYTSRHTTTTSQLPP
jgi:hypothetical protein